MNTIEFDLENELQRNRQIVQVKPASSVHWIARISQSGYMDLDESVFDSCVEAREYLNNELELSTSAFNELYANNSVDLHENNSNMGVSAEHTLWHAVVYSCDCNDPDSHNTEGY